MYTSDDDFFFVSFNSSFRSVGLSTHTTRIYHQTGIREMKRPNP